MVSVQSVEKLKQKLIVVAGVALFVALFFVQVYATSSEVTENGRCWTVRDWAVMTTHTPHQC